MVGELTLVIRDTGHPAVLLPERSSHSIILEDSHGAPFGKRRIGFCCAVIEVSVVIKMSKKSFFIIDYLLIGF